MIEDNFDRKILAEGRNFGFGFSILEKSEDNKYKTLMPFTACKDYLNDFVFVERMNKPLDEIHGFKHKYTGKLQEQEFFYLGVKAVHYKGGAIYKKFEDIKSALETNQVNLLNFLHKLEEYFNVQTRTEIDNYLEDTLILKVPIFWTDFSFLISLYTLLIRGFANITEDELKNDFKDIIINKNNPVIIGDNMLLKGLIKLVNSVKIENLLDYTYPDNADSSTIHNFGISSRLNQIK